MAIKVIEKELTLLERLYVGEVIRGLWLTFGHFARNMFVHIATLFGLSKGRRGAETYQYPEERRPVAPRLRSLHRLTKRPDGAPRCVACMMCETVCPAKCIFIVAGEHPNPNIEKYPIRFDIDLGLCVFCGYCVEACPEDAIRMDTGILEFSAYSREAMVFDLKELLSRSKVPAQPAETEAVYALTADPRPSLAPRA